MKKPGPSGSVSTRTKLLFVPLLFQFLQLRYHLRDGLRVGNVFTVAVDNDRGGYAAESESLDHARRFIGEDGISDLVLFAEGAELGEGIGNALLNGEREDLNMTGLERLPDLFL